MSIRLACIAFALALGSCSEESTNHGGASNVGASNVGALRNVDVTVIYPLPGQGHEVDLLGPADAGRRGALLPRGVFEQERIPELDARTPLSNDTERWASLRVVALRFDPCPHVLVPPPAGTVCEPEIRLVFQSLRQESGATHARDGAIHGFYRLSPSEWTEVVGELRAIRSESAAAPETRLDVHPRLKSEGLGGAYATRLEALIVKYAGEQNLVRVTHFRRLAQAGGPATEWTFAIRERDSNGAWGDNVIPTTTTKEESLVTIVGGRWDADITPVPPLDNSVTKVLRGTVASQRENFRAVVRALNPRAHSSETLDCASCHIAPDVAVFLKRDVPVESFEERFQSQYSLDAAHKSDDEANAFEHMHMLSYSGTSLSVSHRVANETAAVLESLNGP